MNIGVDIDNTINHFIEKAFELALEMNKKFGNGDVIDKNVFVTHGMFNWNKEQLKEFKESYHKIIPRMRLMEDSANVINLLKSEGHKIIFISARGCDKQCTDSVTKKWLKWFGIKYDKLISYVEFENKVKVAKENNIDVFIDDSITVCNLMKDVAKTYIFDCNFNREYNDEKVERVKSWYEFYAKITKKHDFLTKNIIFDADFSKKIGDEFALQYLLKYVKDNLSAVTLESYVDELDMRRYEDSMQESYNKIISLCPEIQDKVYMGSNGFLEYGYSSENPAVKKIIDLANGDKKCVIMCTGAMTNLALALNKSPEISKNLEVLYLGGGSSLHNDNNDRHIFADLKALKKVFSSGIDITVFPINNITEKLSTTIYEVENKLNHDSKLYKDFMEYSDESIRSYFMGQIALVSYLINPAWFYVKDLGYKFSELGFTYGKGINSKKIKTIVDLNADEIMQDMFSVCK